MRMLLVVWRDAFVDMEKAWRHHDELDKFLRDSDCIVTQVGIYVSEDEHNIVLCGGRIDTPDDPIYGSLCSIPKGCIISMREVCECANTQLSLTPATATIEEKDAANKTPAQ